VVFGAGSGITPIFSILKSGLATSTRRFRLLYANRDRDGVIFGPAIEALEQAHPDRLRVVHNLDLDHGFVTPDTVRPLVHDATDPDFFVCGPGPFMDIVEQTLLDEGVDPGRIHVERFTPLVPPVPPPSGSDEDPDADATTSVVTIELDGRTETTDHRPGTTILQTARQLGLSPPFSCEAGNCATCIAKLVEGSVKMHVNDVLDDDEVADGWVLTCQSVPTAPSVRVVYGYEED
jgi:ferredoxin-NADP reductase